MTSENYECSKCGQKLTITRAVPDVPELVRYDKYEIARSSETNELPDSCKSGEYVRHDQVIEVIAAIREEWAHAHEADAKAFLAAIKRAEAAEDKLAQIEKQETVAWRWRSRFNGGAWDSWERGRFNQPLPPFMEVEEQALYAAPVASDAELRAENDKLRAAAKPFAEYGLDYFDKDNTGSPLPDEQGVGWIYLNYGHFRALRTALQEKGERG